jgi:glutamyl-tRNA reductase
MSDANGQTGAPGLFLLGSSHRTAPLEVRERFTLDERGLRRFAGIMERVAELEEWLVLSTCNRVECYGVGAAEELPEAVEQALCEVLGIEPALWERHAYAKGGQEAVEHAFAVAAGLDSQMLGETEILGQIKGTYARFQQLRTVGPVLNRVFQKSFQAAKWARTHTGIGKGQVSIGNVAAELALRICGDLNEARILLVGSGEAGEKTAQALRSRGASALTVTSRTYEKARVLADRLEATAIDFDTFERSLQLFDIVIGSTAAPGCLLTRGQLDKAMKTRRTVPLFLIDLAVPRDFAKNCAQVRNVYLYNLDDLSAVANENLEGRHAEVDACRAQLGQRAAAVWAQLSGTQTPDALEAVAGEEA